MLRDREQAIQAVNACLIEQQDGWYPEPEDAAQIVDVIEALPAVVTNEMARRAARAFYAPASGENWVPPQLLMRNMRRALEAALQPYADEPAGDIAKPKEEE